MALVRDTKDRYRVQWFLLAQLAGLGPAHDVRVKACLHKDAMELSWLGSNGKRYSHEVHIAATLMHPDVVNEFKVKVLMSLAT